MIKLVNCSINEFDDVIKDKKVVCICGGTKFEEFLCMYPAEKVECLVDNYYDKETYEFNGHHIKVIKLNQLTEELNQYVYMITSVKYSKEILAVLDQIDFLHGKECYCLGFLTPDKTAVQLKKHKERVIPKIIHYFWVGGKNIPDEYCKNIETWKKYCPDYEIKLWNESNYDFSKVRYMQQAYEAGKYGFVPDYARIDVVERYGGIYLDTDVEIIRPLDDLLYYDFFCGFEGNNNNKICLGLGFGSRPNHPVLKEMMEVYEKVNFINKDGSFNLIASPHYQSRILANNGVKLNRRTQQNNGITVFASDYFSPFDLYGNGKITDRTYSIHKYEATWHGEKEKMIVKEYQSCYQYLYERLGHSL